MIFVGLKNEEKRAEITRYARENDIKKVLILSPQKYFLNTDGYDIPVRQIEYNETIMYRTFYPLLEEINDTCLIVFNEFMRTAKRTDLVYNCCAKYTNQTPHRLVFEYLPLVSSADDIMVLLDFDTSQRYKGRGLKNIDLAEHQIQMVRRDYSLDGIIVDVPESASAAYSKEVDRLFDNIGAGDPDNIPRRLHKWCNRYRKGYISQHPEETFLAGAASSYHAANVIPRKGAPQGEYTLADLPFSRLEWADLFRDTGMTDIRYVKTPFKVDAAYEMMFSDWRKELEALYAQTGVYTKTSQ